MRWTKGGLGADCAGALESFLKEYKTSPEQTLATALGDVTIDEDELSDEYDFMDEDENAGDRRRQERQRKRQPQHKYMDELQKLANRASNQITIDLDDLETVCDCAQPSLNNLLTFACV